MKCLFLDCSIVRWATHLQSLIKLLRLFQAIPLINLIIRHPSNYSGLLSLQNIVLNTTTCLKPLSLFLSKHNTIRCFLVLPTLHLPLSIRRRLTPIRTAILAWLAYQSSRAHMTFPDLGTCSPSPLWWQSPFDPWYRVSHAIRGVTSGGWGREATLSGGWGRADWSN